MNLYGFVGNDGVNWVDVLGMQTSAMATAWELYESDIIKQKNDGVSVIENVCDCIKIEIDVYTDPGGKAKWNPAHNGFIYHVPLDGDSIPIASGHSEALEPSIKVTWSEKEECKCSKEDQSILVKAQVYGDDLKDGEKVSSAWHKLIYWWGVPSNSVPSQVQFNNQQIGNQDGSGVGKKLRVVVEAQNKQCMNKEYRMTNVGGETNNIPGFDRRPNKPLF